MLYKLQALRVAYYRISWCYCKSPAVAVSSGSVVDSVAVAFMIVSKRKTIVDETDTIEISLVFFEHAIFEIDHKNKACVQDSKW